MPLKKQTFISLDDSDWHGPWMNRQQIMSRIGRQNKVLYSNGPLFSWDIKKNFRLANLKNIIKKQDNVNLLTPGLFFTRIPKIKILDEWAIKRFAKKLNEQWGDGERILYVFHPSYVHYVKHIEYDTLVYHCYDNYSKMKGSDFDLIHLEESICSIADHIFASSEISTLRLANLYMRNDVKFIPNGVDIELFKPPQNTKKYTGKISVGYVGSMNEKFDFELVLNLASALTDINFILVGRANNLSNKDKILLDKIKELPNTHVPGPCNKEDVPKILSNLDVNGFFYKQGSFADDCYPLKLHEAFAIGKPIVSTPIHSLRAYSNEVFFAKNCEEWISQIEFAAKEEDYNKQQRRIDIAKKNTWDIRVDTILKTLR